MRNYIKLDGRRARPGTPLAEELRQAGGHITSVGRWRLRLYTGGGGLGTSRVTSLAEARRRAARWLARGGGCFARIDRWKRSKGWYRISKRELSALLRKERKLFRRRGIDPDVVLPTARGRGRGKRNA